MIKNIIIYISILCIGLVLRVLTFFIYPISFIFREHIYTYIHKRIYESYRNIFRLHNKYKTWQLYIHPYFWLWCFTTNSTDYSGPTWFMKKYKQNWHIDTFDDELRCVTLLDRFIHSIRYFYICYCWNAIRNAHWALNEWFFREGSYNEHSLKILKSEAPYKLDTLIMPELKWDDGNDGGQELRYPYEANGITDEWRTTHEGKKLMTFTTYKGNKRFYYGYCKIIPLYKIKRFLAIEQLFGWNWWNGIVVLHNKYILLKITESSIAKYNKYIKLSNINK